MRRYVVVCCLLCVLMVLTGAVVANAGTRHHSRSHRAAVLPYMGAAPNPTIFGINTIGYYDSQAGFEQNLPTAAQMGTHWVHFTNDSIHFSRSGQPDWQVLDYEIRTAKNLHLGVLLSLGGAPDACSRRPLPSDFTGCPPTTNAHLRAYGAFLRSELLRYRNVVQYYESWLEPDNKAFWFPRANPQQYANLLLTQYRVFQQVNSTYHTQLKLLFGGPISFSTLPADGWAVLPFTNAVLSDLHGSRPFDAIGLHAYRFPSSNTGPADLNWGPTAAEYDYVGGQQFPAQGCSVVYGGYCKMDWSQELSAYEQEFVDHGYGQMPLWLTEFGWPGNASATDALYPGFDEQAQYMSQAYTDLLQLPFVQAAFWFNLRDYQPDIATPDPAFFYHYGMLQFSFAQKPAASVFENLLRANPGR